MSNTKAAKKVPGQINDGFHVVTKILNGDTFLVMADSATQVEDEFQSLYTNSGSSNIILAPPYVPAALTAMVYHNNILNQCVEVMEVNIDGTGCTFEKADPDVEKDATEEKMLAEFFKEPYPGISFVQIRRKLRRALESSGFAALEVLTNMEGDILGLRNLESHTLRFIKLDDPVMVEKVVQRGGVDVKLQMLDRERRFVQRLGNKFYYYREFGSTREVNRNTGAWESDDYPVAPEDRGTQLLIFGVNPDVSSPYSIPRWINQMPSVLGSRKAEEQNLEFLDAGGVPPAIVFVQGGTLAGTAAEQLRNYLSGKNKNKHRAVVVEAQSSSGSMESAGSVKVSVERFGADKTHDAMYNLYDKTTEEHVRIGFRLPALFLGRTDNYNYATAIVAYMVAEEQIFQPERMEFDEIINKTIIRALGVKTVVMKSNGITLKDVTAQIQALTLAQPISEGKGFIEQLNQVAGLELEYKEPAAGVAQDGTTHLPLPPEMLTPAREPGQKLRAPAGKPKSDPRVPSDDYLRGSASKSSNLVDLAMAYGQMRGVLKTNFDLSEDEREQVQKQVQELAGRDLEAFNSIVSSYVFQTADTDLVELVNCAHPH